MILLPSGSRTYRLGRLRHTGSARGRLTRERILRTALEQADARGIEALKMRDLAQALGFEVMALYRHVTSKDEILEGMLDLVLDETEPARPSGDWSDSIRRSALSMRAALARHPWAARLLISPAGLRPRRLEFAEALLARLGDAGLGDEACFHAYHVIDAHVIGYSLWEAGHTLTAAERAAVEETIARRQLFQDYPLLARHQGQHGVEGSHRKVDAFEVALDLLLQGLRP